MQTYWINRKQNNTLIIFFSGWGSDYRPFYSILAVDVDVLMLYEYHQIQLPDDFMAITASYQMVKILAWSLGVWVANKLIPHCDIVIEKAVALNGTLNPIDDLSGIPVAVFDGTLKNLNAHSLVSFYRRMFSNSKHQLLFKQNTPQCSVEKLVLELRCLREQVANAENSLFTKALVSNDDSIFPAINQLRFWQDKLPVSSVSAGHFPFYGFETWDEIISLA